MAPLSPPLPPFNNTFLGTLDEMDILEYSLLNGVWTRHWKEGEKPALLIAYQKYTVSVLSSSSRKQLFHRFREWLFLLFRAFYRLENRKSGNNGDSSPPFLSFLPFAFQSGCLSWLKHPSTCTSKKYCLNFKKINKYFYLFFYLFKYNKRSNHYCPKRCSKSIHAR